MNKKSRIFVAGASGMVGSAIVRSLNSQGYENVIGSYHSRAPGTDYFDRSVRLYRLDLTVQMEVNRFFMQEQPEIVFLAAARVGGIQANNIYPAQFIQENLAIQCNVIHGAWQAGVERLLFLGSSCIYPRQAPQPMREEHLLSGHLEPTNEPYAVAKIAGIKMCEAYNRQYGTRFVAVMPTNLYGPYDNFDLENAHVLPALIRKFHEARQAGAKEVVLWGTGTPRREFLHVDDMAEGCLFLMSLSDAQLAEHLLNYPDPCFVNLGTGVDCTILELALRVKQIVGYGGEIVLDRSKPDGTARKLLDVSKMKFLGWQPLIDLETGIRETYQWYTQYCRQ